jgi:hypothetical protein
MASWDLTALLLRRIEHDLRGLQWQNSGGKGQRPKPIDLPDDPHQPNPAPQPGSSAGAGVAQRLRNLGLLAAGDDKHPSPATGGPLTV